MNKLTSAVKAFLADENGVTAIEYALLAALMGGVLVTVMNGGFGTSIKTAFNAIGTAVSTHAGTIG